VTKNQRLSAWVDEMAALCKPERVHWCDGSPAEFEEMLRLMLASGTAERLEPKKRPNSYLVRSDPADVARVEDRTFICSLSKDNAGPTNNWVNPHEMRKKLKELFAGCMKGRTMYVLPYSMGPVGSRMSQIGVQLTDSPYVVVNMRIMARIGKPIYAEIDRALSAHELIKISARVMDREERDSALTEICARTGAQAVQHIGKVLVVYRKRPDEASPKPSRARTRPATRSERPGSRSASRRPGSARRPRRRPPSRSTRGRSGN